MFVLSIPSLFPELCFSSLHRREIKCVVIKYSSPNLAG